MSKHLSTQIRVPVELDNPSIFRIEEKCVKCGQCKTICKDYISVHDTYDLEQTNDIAVCINCGQCTNVCPTNSLVEKYDYIKLSEEIKKNNDKIIIFNTSPSVRVSLGEEFNMDHGSFVQGQMVSMLRKLGATYVLDTNFSADLTIIEEASELISRIKDKNAVLPQFTSCCPAWVKFVETYYPEMIPHLSSSKSPIGMQGPTVKTYFAQKMGIDPEKIINIAITPCTAKKFEIKREELQSAGAHLGIENLQDMDYVLTTRELALWAKSENIDFSTLEDGAFDNFMGDASGAGVIFGNTGGVMEAALRTCYEYITDEPVPEELYQFSQIRGLDPIREASLTIGGIDLNIAVVYGTDSARKVIEQVKSGEKHYDFIEVMTCPGGCIGGGGQPKSSNPKDLSPRYKRVANIYNRDSSMTVRKSHANPSISLLYKDFYGQPLSPLAEEFLHTTYFSRSKDLGGTIKTVELSKIKPLPNEETSSFKNKFECTICGYIHEADELDPNFICPLCKKGSSFFKKK